MIRFGGCFASYYHWKEAVGPRECRVPILNQCWGGVFSNQVGTHEFLQLCREVGAEPLMCVNTESDGREVESLKIFEIVKDPTDEIMETCPDLFRPEAKTVKGASYTMPPASVAAIEVSLAAEVDKFRKV